MLRKTLVATLAVASLSALSIPLASADTAVRVDFAAPHTGYVPEYRHRYEPEYRHRYEWVPGHWEFRGHRRYWIDGAYVARARFPYGDRDRDGVPNRFDRFPNNPYRY